MPDFEALNWGRHALTISENVTDIDVLRSFDVEGLQRYAEEPVTPDAPWDPIRKLVRIAFRADQPMAVTEAGSVLAMTGSQIDEPDIPRDLATLLRTASDEGVYSERLTSVEGWRLTATLFRLRGRQLGSPAARVLISGMGVCRGVLADALGIKAGSIGSDMKKLAATIHGRPVSHQALADAVAQTLTPLDLPEFPPQPLRAKRLRQMIGQVLLTDKGFALRRRATVQQQSSMLDAMCLRYLDRPFLKNYSDDPLRLVSILRQYASGEHLNAIKIEADYGSIGEHIKTLLGAFRYSITPVDMQQLGQFVSGETEELVLERSAPPRVIHWRQEREERQRRQEQWRKDDRRYSL